MRQRAGWRRRGQEEGHARCFAASCNYSKQPLPLWDVTVGSYNCSDAPLVCVSASVQCSASGVGSRRSIEMAAASMASPACAMHLSSCSPDQRRASAHATRAQLPSWRRLSPNGYADLLFHTAHSFLRRNCCTPLPPSAALLLSFLIHGHPVEVAPFLFVRRLPCRQSLVEFVDSRATVP